MKHLDTIFLSIILIAIVTETVMALYYMQSGFNHAEKINIHIQGVR